MALKPTIYKFNTALSDLDNEFYDSLNLIVALHPSETLERMMARVLAYCLNASANPEFTKGLSDVDQPDIWSRTMDDQLVLWIDVGEPAFERIKKATRLAREVKVYSFNTKSDVWWRNLQEKCRSLSVTVYRFDWQGLQSLVAFSERTMKFSMTITGNTAYIATALGDCEVSWAQLK